MTRRRRQLPFDALAGDAPDGAIGCGEEEFFDRDSESVASDGVGHIVEAMNEFGVEERNSKTQGAGEHGRDQVAAEGRDRHSTFREGHGGVVHGFV